MVRAWLGVAGTRPGHVTSVRIERVRRTLDPASLEWTEVAREPVLEVRP
jgi:hypothetical protein